MKSVYPEEQLTVNYGAIYWLKSHQQMVSMWLVK